MQQRDTTLCPQCQRNAWKLSHVYMAALAILHPHAAADEPLLAEFKSLKPDQPTAQLWAEQFAPPAGQIKGWRALNPDLTVAFMALISLGMLYAIWQQQPGLFVPCCLLLVGLSAAYLFLRKRILAHYQRLLADAIHEKAALEKAVEVWLHLYICLDDAIIIDPENDKHFPSSELPKYLINQK